MTSSEPSESLSGAHGYVPVCELATGGMGRVDLVLRRQGEFRRLFVLKRLHPHLRSDASMRAMFLDEARVAGLLKHPNVVSVLDVGEDEEGPYLVMEYVEGLSLGKLMSLTLGAGMAVPMQTAVRIGIDLASGLHAAHELRDHEGKALGLVHRDLSPQNVLIEWNGAVRLTDFGVAKSVGQGAHTDTGVVKGKRAYLSPEQLRFEPLDRRSDLFALGIVLYEMIAGQRLYRATGPHDQSGMQRILHEPPPDVGEVRPDTPPALVELLLGLLSKEPDHRPATAEEVARTLRRILLDLQVDDGGVELRELLEEIGAEARTEQRASLQAAIDSAERTPSSVRRERSRRRLPLMAALALAGIVGAGVAAVLLTQDRDSERVVRPISSDATDVTDDVAEVDAPGDEVSPTVAAGTPGESGPPEPPASETMVSETPLEMRATMRAIRPRMRERARMVETMESPSMTGRAWDGWD